MACSAESSHLSMVSLSAGDNSYRIMLERDVLLPLVDLPADGCVVVLTLPAADSLGQKWSLTLDKCLFS